LRFIFRQENETIMQICLRWYYRKKRKNPERPALNFASFRFVGSFREGASFRLSNGTAGGSSFFDLQVK